MTTQLPNDLQLDNAFWQFSLSFWQNKKAQKALLRLQDDQQLRINLLLFSMWLGLEQKNISTHLLSILRSTENWHLQVVQPLREVRKALTSDSLGSTLKPQVQNSELFAEQIEQAIFYKCAWDIPTTNCTLPSEISSKTLPHTLLVLTQNLITCSNHAQTIQQLNIKDDQGHKKYSTLSTSDLLLLIQTCLPLHSVADISQCIDLHTPSQ